MSTENVPKIVNMDNIEGLARLAGEALNEYRLSAFLYDCEGNRIQGLSDDPARLMALINKWAAGRDRNPIDIQYNRTLQAIALDIKADLTFAEIVSIHLKDAAPVLRRMMRTDPMGSGLIAGETVPDHVLDSFLALKFKEGMKLWAAEHRHGYDPADPAAWPDQI